MISAIAGSSEDIPSTFLSRQIMNRNTPERSGTPSSLLPTKPNSQLSDTTTNPYDSVLATSRCKDGASTENPVGGVKGTKPNPPFYEWLINNPQGPISIGTLTKGFPGWMLSNITVSTHVLITIETDPEGKSTDELQIKLTENIGDSGGFSDFTETIIELHARTDKHPEKTPLNLKQRILNEVNWGSRSDDQQKDLVPVIYALCDTACERRSECIFDTACEKRVE